MKKNPLKIVVVDDDEFLLKLYEINIGQWPFATELVTFANGRDAIAHVEQHVPNLLIVDWEMPALSGSQILAALHQTFDMRKTRTVVVSGVDAHIIRTDPAVHAQVEVLTKPIPFARLQEIASLSARNDPT